MQLVPSEQYRYCIHVGIDGSVGFTGQILTDQRIFLLNIRWLAFNRGIFLGNSWW